MVNFGPQSTEATPVPSYTTAKEGIVKEPVLLQGAQDIFKQAGGVLKAASKSRADTVLAKFAEAQNKVVDAYEQGNASVRTSAMARTLMRKNLQEFATQYPSLAADLYQFQIKNIEGSDVMFDSVAKGTREEQLRYGQEQEAIDAGIVNPGATKEEMDSAIMTVQQTKAATLEFKQQMDTLDMKLKSNTLKESERKALENQRTEAVNKLVDQTWPTEFNSLKDKFDKIANDPNLSASEKKQALDQEYAAWQANAAAILGNVDGTKASYMSKPMESMYNNYSDVVTGKLDAATLKTQNEKVLEGAKAVLLANPVLAQAAGASGLVGGDVFNTAILNSDGPVRKAVIDAMFSTIGGNAVDSSLDVPNPYSKNPDTIQGMKMGLDVMSKEATSSDPEVRQRAVEAMSNFVQTLGEFEGTIRKDPKGAKAVMDFVKTPQFLKAVKENPQILDNIDGVKEVVKKNYVDEVLQLVQTEFTNDVTSIPPKTLKDAIERAQQGSTIDKQFVDTNSVIAPVFNGSRVQFKALPGAYDPQGTIASKVKRLNKDVAPVLNDTLRGWAHLEGTDDIGKIWEDVGQNIMNGAPIITDPGDNLSISDYTSKLGDVEPLATESIRDLTKTVQLSSGGTMEKVKGMIIHHTGGRGDVNGVVNTLKERGLSVQYVIDRQGNVSQLLPDKSIAYHAGKHNTSGYDNKDTIGVEIIGNNNDDILPIQVQAAKALIKRLSGEYGFDPSKDVFGHGEVAPGWKQATEGMKVIEGLRG